MQPVCGLAIIYLLRVFSRHLGFAKRGELGRVKEGEEGGGVGVGVGVGEGAPFVVLLHSPQASNS